MWCTNIAVCPHVCQCEQHVACKQCMGTVVPSCGTAWRFAPSRDAENRQDAQYAGIEAKLMLKDIASTTSFAKEKDMKEYIHAYLDFESTDLRPMHCRIVQIGCVVYMPEEERSNHSYTGMVHADMPMSDEAQKITGISYAQLKGQPSCGEALTRFFQWLDRIRGGRAVIFIAHNGKGFDFPLLCSELHRWHMPPYQYLRRHGVEYLFDSLLWCRTNVPGHRLIRNQEGRPSYRLRDLHEALLECGFEHAHDALADCHALARVCRIQKIDFTMHDDGYMCMRLSEFCHTWKQLRTREDHALQQRATALVSGRKRSLLDYLQPDVSKEHGGCKRPREVKASNLEQPTKVHAKRAKHAETTGFVDHKSRKRECVLPCT